MSRPGSLPSAADHGRHDALLVAQLSAGDPLTPEQLTQAQGLVATCGACAALAADLRAVSAAVAREPVPPRRRDFFLSPEQAEHLAGNVVTRFLRRLSLPTNRAFGPAAAGVLSVGLIFVVAGYTWPDDAAITVQAEPNLATYSTTPLPSAPAEERFAPLVLEQGLEAAADTEHAADTDEAEALAPGAEFLEQLPEHQAGSSERSSLGSMASEAARSEASEAPEAATAKAGAAAQILPGASPVDGEGLEMGALEAVAADAVAEAPAADLITAAPADDLTLADVSPPESDALSSIEASATTAGSPAPTDTGGPDDLLIILGLVLALAGSAALLLAWLARRSSDPLLR